MAESALVNAVEKTRVAERAYERLTAALNHRAAQRSDVRNSRWAPPDHLSAAMAAEEHDSRALIRLIQAGCVEHYDAFYRRYFPLVHGQVRCTIWDPHEAEDLTQTVFTNVFAALPRFQNQDGRTIRAWLYRITHNAVLRTLQQRARLDIREPRLIELDLIRAELRGPLEVEPNADQDWIGSTPLAVSFRRLPLSQRRVVTLTYVYDYPPEVIAEVLAKSPASVRVLRHRALSQLRMQDLGKVDRVAMRRRATFSPVLQRRRLALATNF